MEQRDDEQQQLEFDAFIVEMLAHLVQSRQMLRGYKEQQDKQNTLTIHHGNERFLYHFPATMNSISFAGLPQKTGITTLINCSACLLRTSMSTADTSI